MLNASCLWHGGKKYDDNQVQDIAYLLDNAHFLNIFARSNQYNIFIVMKKMFLNFKTLGFVALIAAGMTVSSCNQVTKGCMVANDDNYNAAATEDTNPTSCDENATSGKYARTNVTMNINGNSSNGTYLVTVAQGTSDYSIVVTTNWGLVGPSAQNFNFDVTQNQATLQGSPVSYSGGTVGPCTITYNTSTQKISIAITLAGYGAGIDGTTNDTEA